MARQINISCVQASGGAALVDHGRPGQRKHGVSSSGAADRRVANRLREILELPPEAVLLEIALSGGQWLLSGQGQIAIGGAEMQWKLNGRPLEAYTTIDLDGDYLLDGSFAKKGCRAYLAIRGEWQPKKVIGSVSPGVPGVEKIEPGWTTTIDTWEELPYFSDLEPCQHCPDLPLQLQVVPGPEWVLLTSEQQSSLLAATYVMGADSNRQGLRLMDESLATENQDAATPSDLTPSRAGLKSEKQSCWQLKGTGEMISSPVLPGTIQLSPSGPILLLHDAQTLGGFPRILLLADPTDTDRAGQLKAGDGIVLSLR